MLRAGRRQSQHAHLQTSKTGEATERARKHANTSMAIGKEASDGSVWCEEQKCSTEVSGDRMDVGRFAGMRCCPNAEWESARDHFCQYATVAIFFCLTYRKLHNKRITTVNVVVIYTNWYKRKLRCTCVCPLVKNNRPLHGFELKRRHKCSAPCARKAFAF